MSGFNFNSTKDKAYTLRDESYTQVTLTDSTQYDDYDARGLTNNLSIRTGNGATITGIIKKYDGQLLTITNGIAPGRVLKLSHLSLESSSTSRMDLTSNKGNDVNIGYGCSAVLRYDNTQTK